MCIHILWQFWRLQSQDGDSQLVIVLVIELSRCVFLAGEIPGSILCFVSDPFLSHDAEDIVNEDAIDSAVLSMYGDISQCC